MPIASSRPSLRLLLALAAGVTLAGCQFADTRQLDATPQRPTFSSDTSTTAPGTIELETGITIDPGDVFDTPTTLKFGWESNEVFLGFSPLLWVDNGPDDEAGFGDLLVGARYRLLDETDSHPSFGYQFSTKLPSASERHGLGTGETDFFVATMMTKTLEEGLACTAFYQLGILGEDGEGDGDAEHGLAIAMTAPIRDELSFFGELAGRFVHEQSRDDVFATLGASYALRNDFVLDGGCAVGLTHDAQDFVLFIGLTRNFGDPREGWRQWRERQENKDQP